LRNIEILKNMKKATLTNRRNFMNQHSQTAQSKLLTGSTADLFPVILDGGKTIIFISDKSKEAETRQRYGLRK